MSLIVPINSISDTVSTGNSEVAAKTAINSPELQRLVTSAEAVRRWVEKHEYRGYEPFDGLSSPLRSLTFKNLLAERILQQAVRQSPINLRPLVGIKPLDSTKGQGMMAWGYLLQHRATGDAEYWTKAVACLKWLDKHKSAKFVEAQLGELFRFLQSRRRLPQGRQHHCLDKFDCADLSRGLRTIQRPVVPGYCIERMRLDHVVAARAHRPRRLPELFCAWAGIDPQCEHARSCGACTRSAKHRPPGLSRCRTKRHEL